MSDDQAAKLLYDAMLSPRLSAESRGILVDALEMLREDLKADAKDVEALKDLEKKLIEAGMELNDAPGGGAPRG
jgi:hypothetical protein